MLGVYYLDEPTAPAPQSSPGADAKTVVNGVELVLAQLKAALASRDAYQLALGRAGHKRTITTEIREAPEFYYAEDYHQQYLAKNPNGYCGLGGTGVRCP